MIQNVAERIPEVASGYTVQPTGREHELKIWPAQFEAVGEGRKTFEFRLNDRDFQEGDTLFLKRFDPEAQQFTGEAIRVHVTYVLKDRFGVPDGYTVLGIAMTGRTQEATPQAGSAAARRLAELVLGMDMVTEKGMRARALARKVLDEKPTSVQAALLELDNLRARWDQVIRAAEEDIAGRRGADAPACSREQAP